jgi:hypothetical protein
MEVSPIFRGKTFSLHMPEDTCQLERRSVANNIKPICQFTPFSRRTASTVSAQPKLTQTEIKIDSNANLRIVKIPNTILA